MSNLQQTKKKLRDEFRALKFGMFIHFGLYSLGEDHEWHLHRHLMSLEKYQKKFLTKFDPDPAGMEQWVVTAKQMGAKYLTVTSKHHDGFCLWNSEIPRQVAPEYHIRNTPFYKKHGKDVITFLFEAAKKHNMKIGLYYSTIDWSWTQKPWFKPHPKIPSDPKILDQYNEYYLAQLHELKQKFPSVIDFWFDGYQFQETYPQLLRQKLVYEDLSAKYPDLLVVSNPGAVDRAKKYLGVTDFLVLENAGHAESVKNAPDKEIKEAGLPGELCFNLNRHWGYNAKDKSYKTPEEIATTVKSLNQVDTNALLNFGPHWNGFILDEQVEIAKKIGKLLVQ